MKLATLILIEITYFDTIIIYIEHSNLKIIYLSDFLFSAELSFSEIFIFYNNYFHVFGARAHELT